MKVLIPSNFTLATSNVPIDEAQPFTHRVYKIADLVVYNNLIYQRLTAVSTYDDFDNSKYYVEGDTVTYSAINYLCIATLNLTAPNIDTTNWQSITPTVWANTTAYSVGIAVTYNGKTFYCIKSHTSISAGDYPLWVYGQGSTYYPKGCEYNGRFYKRLGGFQAGKTASRSAPNTRTDIWQDITDVIAKPAISSIYWQDITDQTWNGQILYNQGTAVIYSGVVYKAINDIVMPYPSSDTTRWAVTDSTLPTNTTDWKSLGAVNRFRMFDQFLTTKTEMSDSIEFTVLAPEFNSFYLGNIYADTIDVEVIDNASGLVIESASYDMFYDVGDWFDYFFGEWIDQRKPSLIYERTTVVSNVSVHVTLSGDICKCGLFTIGKSKFVGNTQWDIDDESIDYSTSVTDTETGETYLSQGNEVPMLSVNLFVNTGSVDSIKSKLKEARGKPVVFYDRIETTKVYGFIKKRSIMLSGPVKTIITLDIQGLI